MQSKEDHDYLIATLHLKVQGVVILTSWIESSITPGTFVITPEILINRQFSTTVAA